MELENVVEEVEETQEYPDLVLRIEETTFGEQARNVMDTKKQKEEWKILLKCVCALLNSGGGVLCVKIKNHGYNYNEDGIGKDLEDGLNSLLDSARVEEFVQITQQDDIMRFFVRSWFGADGKATLCSLNSGLVERSGRSAFTMSSTSVRDFLNRREEEQKDTPVPELGKRKLEPGYDDIYDKASEFYSKEEAHLNQTLDFGESVNVELQSFNSEKKLLTRLKETLPRSLSAFGNTSGGFLFIGIDDKTQKVVGCGQGLRRDELKKEIQAICNKDQAIHMNNCKREIQWSPEVKVFEVTPAQERNVTEQENETMKEDKMEQEKNVTEQENETMKEDKMEQEKNVTEQENLSFIVAIKIQPFCCAVFEKDPESWEVKGDTVSQIKFNYWWKKIQLLIPDEHCSADDDLSQAFESLNLLAAPPCCKPVYSIEKITELQKRIFPVTDNSGAVPESMFNELFNEYPEVQSTFTDLQQRSGILIVSRSWAVDVNRFKNEGVLADALLITSGDYPRFYSIVENETPDLRTYARETAFHLKQKLVNVGGYTGRICVIPHLVKCNTGELIQNKNDNVPPLYPQSYKLGGKEEIEALLRSLVIVVLSFTSPMSDKLGSEFLNLLTEEQFSILCGCSGIKNLFIHGLPGTGKTVLAMEKMRQIRNTEHCSSENILFVCENVGLKAFMRKRNLCICETRYGFMKKDISEFSAVKHIVVDEGQNFRDEHGDWYGRAQELTQKEGGVLWVFLDYFQKCHPYNDGLPQLKDQKIVRLHKVVRNSTKVFDVVEKHITTIAQASHGDMSTHLKGMKENMTQDHFFKGDVCSIKLVYQPSNTINFVGNLLKNGHSARDIAVLFPNEKDSTLNSLRVADLSFPCGDVESIDDDVVVLDTIRRFSGLERNIVIVVNPAVHPKQSKIEPNFLLSAYSRARVRLYISN